MRNHELKVGDTIYDANRKCFGIITQLLDGYASIDMEGDSPEKNNPDWCCNESEQILNIDIPECEMHWVTSDLDSLYQVAWGFYDKRKGEAVCYEHNPGENGYQFYSPYLDEQLYAFEIDFWF